MARCGSSDSQQHINSLIFFCCAVVHCVRCECQTKSEYISQFVYGNVYYYLQQEEETKTKTKHTNRSISKFFVTTEETHIEICYNGPWNTAVDWLKLHETPKRYTMDDANKNGRE